MCHLPVLCYAVQLQQHGARAAAGLMIAIAAAAAPDPG
jgi:hypothetical protein